MKIYCTANKAVCHIYGCDRLEAFKDFTGFNFRGMVHREDYEQISDSIRNQVSASRYDLGYIVFRIISRGDQTRWIDNYGHFVASDVYKGLLYVFILDIIEELFRVLDTYVE